MTLSLDGLLERTAQSLQLAGMSERTVECYVRQVRMLSEFHGMPADELSEEEVRAYLLHRQTVSLWAPTTMRICHAALRFFFRHVAPQEWPILSLMQPRRERKLPTILTVDEVNGILASTCTFHNQVYFATVYSCGLRLNEGLPLQVSDIHSERGLLHVHRGKGAKDRMVPLPKRTLHLQRAYWSSHQNRVWLFPARGKDNKQARHANRPMHESSPQGALRRVLKESGILYKGVSIKTFRHCYATHLLEAGVNVHQIQKWMGHSSLKTTMSYLHLTSKGQENACQILNGLMGGLAK